METLSDIIRKGESKTLEFKEQIPSNLSIAKTVIAFSNTAGGKLIIGVRFIREEENYSTINGGKPADRIFIPTECTP